MTVRVLVVDEAAFVRDSMKRALRSFLAQVEVHDAANGNRAIAALKGNKIDMVLSDWDLPELDGAELLAWLRNEERYKKTPFIVVSSGGRDQVVKAIEAGASDFLNKPFSPDDLQKKVVKQLSRVGMKAKQKTIPGQEENPFALLTSKAKSPKTNDVKTANLAGNPLLGGAAKARPAPKPKAAPKGNANGSSAKLQFNGHSVDCKLNDISLQALNGMIPREDEIPKMFETLSMDINSASGESIAHLNGYVHSMQAAELRSNSQQLRIMVRFENNPPESLEGLSKFVAR